jgi:hypothetical protein
MNGDCWHLQEESSCDILQEFIEIFDSKGWLNKELRIKYQNERYWVSCNGERFFAYQINENCALGPGVPGWPVCIIRKDYFYDESKIPYPTSTKLNTHDWLNIIANKEFELI